MPERILKVGVIGLGVGERHVVAYQAEPDVVVRAVCDIDPAKLAEVGDRCGIGLRHTDYRRITEDPEIDVVSICSFDDAHAEQALSAFRNGKHVMVEKPVVLHRRDAERLLRAQQDSGRLLTSNLILRRSPRFLNLKRRMDAGDFGEIVSIEGDYLHDILWKITEGWRGRMDFYSVVYGGGVHLIDLMRWLLGQEVVEVCAMGNRIFSRDSAYRYDDTIAALLRFERGTLGKSMTSLGARRTKFHGLNVYGTRMSFVNDLPHAKFFTGDRLEDEFMDETPYPAIEKGDLLPGFLAAIRSGGEPPVGVQDVFRVMDVCFAVHDATLTNSTVKVAYMI